jgi:hypothetical protein
MGVVMEICKIPRGPILKEGADILHYSSVDQNRLRHPGTKFIYRTEIN